MKRVISAVLFVLIVAIIVVGALVLINKLTYIPDSEVFTSESVFPVSDVSRIKIDLAAGYADVYTITGSVIVVGFAEPKSGTYTAAVDGDGTLTVTDASSSFIDSIESISRGDSGRYGIRIGVPANVSVECDIDVDYGNVSIEGITAPSVTVDMDTGSLIVIAVNTDDITMNVKEGDVTAAFPDTRENYFVETNLEGDKNGIIIGGGSKDAPHRIEINVDVGEVTMSYKE